MSLTPGPSALDPLKAASFLPFSSALLPVHQQLRLQSSVHQAPEVRRRHHTHRTHLW
ncbi:hypothetical protein LDENG_00064200 [Lucifuga dentata]|nr:hypothetical protein LDENG_00064200 [Lucifuga dentata]